MIRFEKEELSFLELYKICVSNKREMYGKVQIKTFKDKGIVRFSQISDTLVLYTDIQKPIKDDFELIVSTQQITEIVKLSRYDEVYITKDSLLIKEGTYNLDRSSFNYSEVDDVVNQVNSGSNSEFNFTDINKVKDIKLFMGSDSDNRILSGVGLFYNRYVVTDRLNVIATTRISDRIDDPFFISEQTISLLNTVKQNTLNVKFYPENNFYFYRIGKINIASKIQKYSIPNIFEERYTTLYDFNDKVVINRDKVLSSLKRLRIIANTNNNSGKIGINITNNKISFLCSTSSSSGAEEIVDAEVDKDLYGISVYLPINIILNIINSIKSDNIIMKFAKSSEQQRIMTVEDEEKDLFFINTLFVK